MNEPIARVSLQSQIMKYIQNYIRDNNLKPGDKLPSQGQFIEMMHVSRTALREAVKTLEAGRIIEVVNGKGLYVGTQEKSEDVFSSLLDTNAEREQLLEALEARRAIENAVIAMVIHKATDQELEELGKAKNILMYKYHKGMRQTEEDKEFHRKLNALCHNKIMYSLLAHMNDKLEQFWQFPLHMEDPFLESIPYHEELYLAICERNVQKAHKVNNKLLDCIYRDIVGK